MGRLISPLIAAREGFGGGENVYNDFQFLSRFQLNATLSTKLFLQG